MLRSLVGIVSSSRCVARIGDDREPVGWATEEKIQWFPFSVLLRLPRCSRIIHRKGVLTPVGAFSFRFIYIIVEQMLNVNFANLEYFFSISFSGSRWRFFFLSLLSISLSCRCCSRHENCGSSVVYGLSISLLQNYNFFPFFSVVRSFYFDLILCRDVVRCEKRLLRYRCHSYYIQMLIRRYLVGLALVFLERKKFNRQ